MSGESGDLIPDGLLYIGENDCKKATCNERQEFPGADDPYCIRHSLEDYFAKP